MVRKPVNLKTDKKSNQVKELALQGLKRAEIIDLVDSSPSAVNVMMDKLKKDPNFTLKFTNSERKISYLKQAIFDVFYRFHTIHGFTPTASWVSRVCSCSREYVRRIRPLVPVLKESYVYIERVELSTTFIEFVDSYAKVFGISRREAIKSVTRNMSWDGVDFDEINKDLDDFQDSLQGKR